MSNKYEMNNATKISAVLRTVLSLALALLFVVIVNGSRSQVVAQKSVKGPGANRLVQQNSNDAATVMFRGGRDLITDQKWTKAEEVFSQYVDGYPKEKNIDAALYWMAYSQYQQTKFTECKKTIERLLSKYQDSSWKDDARTLLAQVPGSYSVVYAGAGSGQGVGFGQGQGAITVRPAAPVAPVAPIAPATWDVTTISPAGAEWGGTPMAAAQVRSLLDEFGSGGRPADDDPCEFKIVVLQALFQSDVQRGVTAATEWLAPGSTQTVRCKGAALTLLARHGGKAVTPVILNIAKSEPDIKLRARAISALGSTNDESVIDPLRDFALNSQENDIVEASLYALGQNASPRAITVLGEIAMSGRSTGLRRIAISSISNRPGEPAVDQLLKIYDADQSLEIRKAVIAGFGHRKSDRAGAKLLEIARGADNIELRKSAIGGIASRDGEKAIDVLLNLYDTEKSDELKDRIISSLGRTNDTRVTRKMIEIARNPQTPIERRRRIIGVLSGSKDPEVIKFLEDLLNK